MWLVDHGPRPVATRGRWSPCRRRPQEGIVGPLGCSGTASLVGPGRHKAGDFFLNSLVALKPSGWSGEDGRGPREVVVADSGVRRRGRGLPRSRGVLVRRGVAESLVSVAGLVGAPVRDPQGNQIGRLVDVVVRWDRGAYPQVSGLVVRVGFRRVFWHDTDIGALARGRVQLDSTRLDLRDFARRAGEQLLVKDVLDHQLVDVDGARVVRAADLYLSRLSSRYWVVGVDVSFVSFLRRILPRFVSARPTPEKVLDFSTVQPFGPPGGPVRLRRPHRGLRRMRPAAVADLLEELGRPQRQALLSMLEPDTAADVLEEMAPEHLELLLREVPQARAAELVARMEPDEAVDALRDLSELERELLLSSMPTDRAAELTRLLSYPKGVAGGIMTTNILVVYLADTVEAVRVRVLRHHATEDIDGLVVVDDQGRLVDDLSLFDLLAGNPGQPVSELVRAPYPGTVQPDADLDEVVEQLTGNRGASLVVVDPEGHPLGRILADDVVDALVESRAGRHWPWQVGP
jgi:CBS domain-containing protein